MSLGTFHTIKSQPKDFYRYLFTYNSSFLIDDALLTALGNRLNNLQYESTSKEGKEC